MVYTLDVIDKKSLKNKRRVRVFEVKSKLIFEDDFKNNDDVPEELEDENIEILGDYEGIRFKKGIDAGVLLKYTQKILKK